VKRASIQFGSAPRAVCARRRGAGICRRYTRAVSSPRSVIRASPISRDDPEHRFAATEGVYTLYKFCPFSTDERRRWVREILVEHKIYFARPSQLNDPYDLRPLVRLRPALTERELRDRLRADAEEHWARQRPPPTAEQLAAYRLRLATIDLQTFERETIERIRRRLDEHYRIFSLAVDRGAIHMWDDYADRRRGLCIHFRSDVSSPFGFAQRVIYQSDRPELLVPFENLPERDVADRATLIKTRARWDREVEYRLVRYPGLDYSEAGLRFDGDYGYFPADAITGITVGTDMPEEDRTVVAAYARQHSPGLRVEVPHLIDRSAMTARRD
jgi:hypothetical protein